MKSKSAKRVLSILIIFALSVATASPAIAVEPNNSHESDIQVFSAFDQFANVFPDVDDTVAAQSADNAAPSTQTGGSADYTYTITIDPLTNTGTASVNLTLNIGEHLYLSLIHILAGTRESASAEAANLAKRFIVNSSKTAGHAGNLLC